MMPQFFIPSSMLRGNRCRIEGEDYRHLAKVRRIREGDLIRVRIEGGAASVARVVRVGEGSLEAEIVREEPAAAEPVRLVLCAALMKGKKFDLVVQKAAEIGVKRIIPVVTERVIPDLSEKEEKRLERWRRIAREAAKQSLRSDLPAVEGIARFAELAARDLPGMKILAHAGGDRGSLKERLRGAEKGTDLNLLVGPEGGFSPKEVGLAERHGWEALHFGFTQLRAETAAIVLPAVLIYEWMADD